RSALPVWAEFMNRAARYKPYRDAAPFAVPPGVQSVSICTDSGQLAGPFCPRRVTEGFLKGSAIGQQCAPYESGEGMTPAEIMTISEPDDGLDDEGNRR